MRWPYQWKSRGRRYEVVVLDDSYKVKIDMRAPYILMKRGYAKKKSKS